MRYPNTRYGCPGTFEYYAQGRTIKELAKHLKRSERTIKDWLEGKKKIPFWVPELLRLQHMEYQKIMYQMRIKPQRLKLGLITGSVIAFPAQNGQSTIKGPDRGAVASQTTPKPLLHHV